MYKIENIGIIKIVIYCYYITLFNILLANTF
jgi:hypothetical protein